VGKTAQKFEGVMIKDEKVGCVVFLVLTIPITIPITIFLSNRVVLESWQ